MLELIQERTVKGVVAMCTSQGLLILISFFGTVILARLLGPADFGMYAVINFFVLTAYYFTDFGLAGTLIQRRAEPNKAELRTVFAFQMMLTSVIAGVLLLLSPVLVRIYRLDTGLILAMQIPILTLLATPFESVSVIVLERKLAYTTTGSIQVICALIYMGVAISLALLGLGVWSLVSGAVAASLCRALLAVVLSRWPVGVRLDRGFIACSIRSGGYYQAGGILAIVRDNAAQLVAGPMFGPAAVGYLTWARNLTFVVSQVFAHAFARVGYSSVSRIQQESEAMAKVAEKMMTYLMLLTAPTLAVLLGLSHPIIRLIYTEKWLAAVPAIYLFGFRMLGSNFTTLFAAFLNGTGRFKLTTKILTFWTGLDLCLSVILASSFGFYGVAAASAFAVWIPAAWMVREFKATVAINLWEAAGKPTLAAVIVFVSLQTISPHVNGLWPLLGAVASGYLLFLTITGFWAVRNGFRIGDVSLQAVRRLWSVNATCPVKTSTDQAIN